MPAKFTLMSPFLAAAAVLLILASSNLIVGSAEAQPSRRLPAVTSQDLLNDWLAQDAGADASRLFTSTSGNALELSLVRQVMEELPSRAGSLDAELARLKDQSIPGANGDWKNLYELCCKQRRSLRLSALLNSHPEWVFVKRHQFGGSHYAYTEGQSDAQAERCFSPGCELCGLDLRTGAIEVLLEDPQGVVRDPAVSYDGNRVLFSWKRSDRQDDYHLYELELSSGKRKQLTSQLGVADYEGQYLPNGKIVFNSTRCVQTVDCWWTEVSNLYLCEPDGSGIRRLGYDQVHANYPTVLNDGRLVYTRWDYNDRGQIYPQPLCSMYPDGSHQAAFYGNSSWFPTSLLHARAIPGSKKLVAIASGHHCNQRGKLCLVDLAKGREEAEGIQLISPLRETKAVRVDSYGQDGMQFQYPYPLSETEFIVAADPVGSPNYEYRAPYGLYWINTSGKRELLARDPRLHCLQPFPLQQRAVPPVLQEQYDPKLTTATCQIQDVYVGDGTKGIARGSAAKIRVVQLEYRAAGVGCNYSDGVAGGALSSTPISVGNGAWDVKRVLGEATVREDGSACFTVPANSPVYFQVLDAQGQVLQTMRSWTTFMPGEKFACIGCHADRKKVPEFFFQVHNPGRSCTSCHEQRHPRAAPSRPGPLARLDAPEKLTAPSWGEGGFSFPKLVQPILDRHCVRCHDNSEKSRALIGMSVRNGASEAPSQHPFSLTSTPVSDPESKREWSLSYLALTRSRPSSTNPEPKAFAGDSINPWLSWIDSQSTPSLLPPRSFGSAQSQIIAMLQKGHHRVQLSHEEMRVLCCWIDLGVPFCGDYREANAWTQREMDFYNRYEAKRARFASRLKDEVKVE